MTGTMTDKEMLFEYVLRLADDHLVLAHRLSEWCGHAPMLEEDLALPNIALDLLGQARALYTYAGEIEGAGRGEDQLAYLRPEHEYRNLLLLELDNGDFARTMLRLYLFAALMELFWEAMLSSKDEMLAAIAAKAIKETRYHVRHSAEWVIRLGDGTAESARRMNEALEDLQPYCSELFETDSVTAFVAKQGIGVDPATLEAAWQADIAKIFREARLNGDTLADGYQTGGRSGQHTEAMGYLLADLQYMQRAYPGMEW
ncbi:MAG: phenylacetate-CoA oxygenase subunit PaaC [Phyllobacteriaceae bacterium]|nr:phenylacetate-CoA oxygenase subunit PaaC [Phyllobacteriaceae bacterium]